MLSISDGLIMLGVGFLLICTIVIGSAYVVASTPTKTEVHIYDTGGEYICSNEVGNGSKRTGSKHPF